MIYGKNTTLIFTSFPIENILFWFKNLFFFHFSISLYLPLDKLFQINGQAYKDIRNAFIFMSLSINNETRYSTKLSTIYENHYINGSKQILPPSRWLLFFFKTTTKGLNNKIKNI
uniref:Uncharacterized protein n=1 Tax=Orbilia oligospora TaxID=2813651 RepID=A0A6H2U2G6_ORBOL|nr:hypothetical protein [Orbilia oligospora]QID02776.1 hypothetical protein [Orbilia oligospora]QID02891.1 hypothetical protein [Orbilia oligospora]